MNMLGKDSVMSVQNRKIGYFTIDFEDGDERFFDKNIFKRLLTYINGLSGADRIITDKKTSKAVDIQKIDIYKKGSMDLAKVVFKSCKFNHSPNYMSSVDGTERKTDKKLTEGEKEITHMIMRIDDNEAYTICEQRRAGVNISSVIKFLNMNLNKMKVEKDEDVEDFEGKIAFGYIPAEEFLELIDSSDRIVSAELYTERKLLGTEYLDILELDDNSREDIVVTVKAKPRQSLAKRALKDSFNKFTSAGSKVQRIRLYAKDENNYNVIIDTSSAKKMEEITVELKEDGTVDTYSIFSKMEDLLGVTE